MSGTMNAVVMHAPGGPEVLQLETRPIPRPDATQVLIQIHAFGLNRSELFTRQGHSPGVHFPRILGIEAVGTVADAPGGQFSEGQVVATVMGGMGRSFDGSYAEYVVVPAAQVRSVPPGAPCSGGCGWHPANGCSSGVAPPRSAWPQPPWHAHTVPRSAQPPARQTRRKW